MEIQKKDEDLALLIQKGKTEFLGELINRYDAKISRYARKFLSDGEDIKDIVQEVFTKAYVNIQSFDTKRKFSSWLYRIAHNELVNHIKRKKNKTLPLFNLDVFLPHNFSVKSIDEEIDRKNMEELLNEHIDKVEPKYREPLLLYYLEELSYKEISDIMKIPVSTVGVRIVRAKKIIKKILENNKKF